MNKSAQEAILVKYKEGHAKVDKTVKKSRIYMNRAHLYFEAIGMIIIELSFLLAWLAYSAKAQRTISPLSGLGSLGYGSFWMFSGYLEPGMGFTGTAKESVGLIPQVSGGAFFIFGILLLNILIRRMFVAKQLSEEN